MLLHDAHISHNAGSTHSIWNVWMTAALARIFCFLAVCVRNMTKQRLYTLFFVVWRVGSVKCLQATVKLVSYQMTPVAGSTIQFRQDAHVSTCRTVNFATRFFLSVDSKATAFRHTLAASCLKTAKTTFLRQLETNRGVITDQSFWQVFCHIETTSACEFTNHISRWCPHAF